MVGQIVHYVPRELSPTEQGLAWRLETKQDPERGRHYAALVVYIYPPERLKEEYRRSGIVKLHLFLPSGERSFAHMVEHSEENRPDTWHWLEECTEQHEY